MKYDTEKRDFLQKKYTELKSCVLVQRSWRATYKNIKAPPCNTIKSIVAKFPVTGSIHNRPRKRPDVEQRRKVKLPSKKLFNNLNCRLVKQHRQLKLLGQ